MAAINFYIWLLFFISYKVCDGTSHDCYKVDGNNAELKGTYTGLLLADKGLIGSIRFAVNTGYMCSCNFPSKHSYSIQNVTYYGDDIPKIKKLFNGGCQLLQSGGLVKSGFHCSVNVSTVQANHDVSCKNTVISTIQTQPPTSKISPEPVTNAEGSSSVISTSKRTIPVTTSSTRYVPFPPTRPAPSTSHTKIQRTSQRLSTTTPLPTTHSQTKHVTSFSASPAVSDMVSSVHSTDETTHDRPSAPTSFPGISTASFRFTPELEGPSTKRSTEEHIETSTKKEPGKHLSLQLEIIIPVVIAASIIIFIIGVFVCIRKQREKKRIFKYEVSPNSSMRSTVSDKEEILKYNNDFHDNGTKHNILYEGEDYCEHGIFNKTFIETNPEASKKDEKVYAPAVGAFSQYPEDLVLEGEEQSTTSSSYLYVTNSDSENIIPANEHANTMS